MKENKATRTAAVCLALMMLTFPLASCGNRTDGETEEKNSPAEPQAQTQVPEAAETEAETEDLFASYREIDLGGQTVRVSVSSNLADSSTISSFVYTAGPEELVGEACQDYVYERNLFIQDLLNCGLEYESVDLIYNAVEAYIAKLVQSGDSTFHYYQYTTITGTVIASDEDIAKELIEEYFVEGTDNIIDSCEVEFINAVMPGVQDYKFKGIVYSKN